MAVVTPHTGNQPMSRVRVRYQTFEFGEIDIHVRTLRDRQQYDDSDLAAARAGVSAANWPLFGIVWDSSEVLARIMYGYEVAGLRILEAGCGIGLASLVLQSRAADITASDKHPAAAHYLSANTQLNGFATLPFATADWAAANLTLGDFDLIIGSDLLYEAWGVDLLARFVERHSKPNCTVILVDPGRGLQGRFRSAMVKLGYRIVLNERISSALNSAYRGHLLKFEREAASG